MLRITDNKGFQLSFKNGLTVSVQFGYGNYCSNKKETQHSKTDCRCNNAEVAVFRTHPDDTVIDSSQWMTHKFFPKIDDDVVGWLNTDEIATLIRRVKIYKLR